MLPGRTAGNICFENTILTLDRQLEDHAGQQFSHKIETMSVNLTIFSKLAGISDAWSNAAVGRFDRYLFESWEEFIGFVTPDDEPDG
jgi:hypothetical protein